MSAVELLARAGGVAEGFRQAEVSDLSGARTAAA
jgi:hypothetical protein